MDELVAEEYTGGDSTRRPHGRPDRGPSGVEVATDQSENGGRRLDRDAGRRPRSKRRSTSRGHLEEDHRGTGKAEKTLQKREQRLAVNDDDVPENDDQPGHINEREAVAAVLALETASGPAVLITDSRVVEAAIRRGRSRNVVVNAAVAYIIEQLGLIGVAWVPTKRNKPRRRTVARTRPKPNEHHYGRAVVCLPDFASRALNDIPGGYRRTMLVEEGNRARLA